MKKFGLGNNYVYGSVLLIGDIYGVTISEESKGKTFKYKVTDFDDYE